MNLIVSGDPGFCNPDWISRLLNRRISTLRASDAYDGVLNLISFPGCTHTDDHVQRFANHDEDFLKEAERCQSPVVARPIQKAISRADLEAQVDRLLATGEPAAMLLFHNPAYSNPHISGLVGCATKAGIACRIDDTSNLVFTFGSNDAGRHGKGAAQFAKDHWGARYGIGEGITGKSYALPTKAEIPGTRKLATLTLDEIKIHVDKFIAVAEQAPQRRFHVTSIGCGLAGYKPEQIAPLFARAPENCDFPNGWKALFAYTNFQHSAEHDDRIEEWAMDFQHDHWIDDHPAFIDAADAAWGYQEAYPISSFRHIGVFATNQAALLWIKNEIKNFEGDGSFGRADNYRRMLTEPIIEPVFAMEVDGKAFLWDGWHRIAIAMARNDADIRAYVGAPHPTLTLTL